MNHTPKDAPHPFLKAAMRLYNSGYKAGHHDTVEAAYIDIHNEDMDNYHEEEAREILDEIEGGEELNPEQWAEFIEALGRVASSIQQNPAKCQV